jgi:hypothetical protein
LLWRENSPLLFQNQQNDIRGDVKEDEKDFESPEETVKDELEALFRHRKEFALHPVNQVRECRVKENPEDQQTAINDGAPHKKVGQGLALHASPPFGA